MATTTPNHSVSHELPQQPHILTLQNGPARPVLEAPQLRQALLRQLEYYFSKENLDRDDYLKSQMNKEMYVPISVVAGFKMVKLLTTDMALIVDVLRSSKEVAVNDVGDLVRPIVKPQRSTLILRDIKPDVPVADVQNIFNTPGCAQVKSLKADVGNTWFVAFESEEDAVKTLDIIRLQMFNGHAIQARVKSESPLKVSSAPFIPMMQQRPPPQPQQPAPSAEPFYGGNQYNQGSWSNQYYYPEGDYQGSSSFKQSRPVPSTSTSAQKSGGSSRSTTTPAAPGKPAGNPLSSSSASPPASSSSSSSSSPPTTSATSSSSAREHRDSHGKDHREHHREHREPRGTAPRSESKLEAATTKAPSSQRHHLAVATESKPEAKSGETHSKSAEKEKEKDKESTKHSGEESDTRPKSSSRPPKKASGSTTAAAGKSQAPAKSEAPKPKPKALGPESFPPLPGAPTKQSEMNFALNYSAVAHAVADKPVQTERPNSRKAVANSEAPAAESKPPTEETQHKKGGAATQSGGDRHRGYERGRQGQSQRQPGGQRGEGRVNHRREEGGSHHAAPSSATAPTTETPTTSAATTSQAQTKATLEAAAAEGNTTDAPTERSDSKDSSEGGKSNKSYAEILRMRAAAREQAPKSTTAAEGSNPSSEPQNGSGTSGSDSASGSGSGQRGEMGQPQSNRGSAGGRGGPFQGRQPSQSSAGKPRAQGSHGGNSRQGIKSQSTEDHPPQRKAHEGDHTASEAVLKKVEDAAPKTQPADSSVDVPHGEQGVKQDSPVAVANPPTAESHLPNATADSPKTTEVVEANSQ